MGKLLSMLRSPDTLVHVMLASLHSQPLGQMYDDDDEVEAATELSSTSSASSANRGSRRSEVVDDDATPDDVIVLVESGNGEVWRHWIFLNPEQDQRKLVASNWYVLSL